MDKLKEVFLSDLDELPERSEDLVDILATSYLNNYEVTPDQHPHEIYYQAGAVRLVRQLVELKERS